MRAGGWDGEGRPLSQGIRGQLHARCRGQGGRNSKEATCRSPDPEVSYSPWSSPEGASQHLQESNTPSEQMTGSPRNTAGLLGAVTSQAQWPWPWPSCSCRPPGSQVRTGGTLHIRAVASQKPSAPDTEFDTITTSSGDSVCASHPFLCHPFVRAERTNDRTAQEQHVDAAPTLRLCDSSTLLCVPEVGPFCG